MSRFSPQTFAVTPNGATQEAIADLRRRVAVIERGSGGITTTGGAGTLGGVVVGPVPASDLDPSRWALSAGGQLSLSASGTTGGLKVGGDVTLYRDASGTAALKGVSGITSLRLRSPTTTGSPDEATFIDWYDGASGVWRIIRQSDGFGFVDLTTNKTRLKILSTGTLQMATLPPSTSGAAFEMEYAGVWNGTESKQRAMVSHWGGFAGGIAGRGQTNDDVPTVDQINNAFGAGFTQWEGMSCRVPSSGLGFNERGTWCGQVSDVTAPETAAFVQVTATSNPAGASDVVVTYAGAGANTWGYTAILDGDHAAGATTLNVKVTTPFTDAFVMPTRMFRSSGSIFVAGVTHTYSGKTDTSFTGLSPAVGSPGYGSGAVVHEANSLRTGDSVNINGTGLSALDGKNFIVTVIDSTHFSLNGMTTPGGAYSGTSGVVRKLIYKEAICHIGTVTADARGSYSSATEFDISANVPCRGSAMNCSINPALDYTQWNDSAIFGSTSAWKNFGVVGLKLQNTSGSVQAGTAVLVNTVVNTPGALWKRAFVINNGSAPNSTGSDVFTITGAGRMGFGTGATEDQVNTIPCRITFSDSTVSTGGIQFGHSTGPLNLYRYASGGLRVETGIAGGGLQINQSTSNAESFVGLANAATPIWRLTKTNATGANKQDLKIEQMDAGGPIGAFVGIRINRSGTIKMNTIADGTDDYASITMSPTVVWNDAGALSRLGIAMTTGFTGGTPGRGLSNDDIPSDDKINGFAGAFTEWAGIRIDSTTGGTFNARGTLVGMASSVQAAQVAISVAISNVTNTTNPTVTYAGADATWGTGLATGDSVYISGTGTSLDNKNWVVASTPTSTTFTITTAAPGAYSATTPLVRKLVYHEALGGIFRADANSQGAYVTAIEADTSPAVPSRSASITCSVNPGTTYSSYNDAAVFGANSSWLDTGVRGLQLQNTAAREGGTAIFINAVDASYPWHSALVVNNGSSPNARGTNVFRLSGTGELTAGGGVQPYTGTATSTGYLYAAGFFGTTAVSNWGTVTNSVTNQVYFIGVEVPRNWTFNGVGFMVGTPAPAGTEKCIVGLYDQSGNLVAQSNASPAAGNYGTTANAWAEVAFTSAYTAKGPGRYFIAVQFNGAYTGALRTLSFANTNAARHLSGTTTPGSFAIPSSITPPTTGSTLNAPISYLY